MIIAAVMLVATASFLTASAAWLLAAQSERIRADVIARTFAELTASGALTMALVSFIIAWKHA